MSQQARVSSLEALDGFRSRLIVYVGQARATLEEVSSDVVRTRNWIENEQRTSWENQFRQRARTLDEARQALLSARLSSFREATSLEQLAVHRAQRALQEAEDKLRTIRRWARDYDNRVQPLVKQMEKLHTVVTQDLGQAIAQLGGFIQTLAAYAETSASPPSRVPPPSPAPDPDAPTGASDPVSTP